MSTENERPLMTSSEVAALFRVDAKTVTEWARTGRIPRVRTPGGSLRFRETDVQKLLDQSTETSGPGSPLTTPTPGPDPSNPTPGRLDQWDSSAARRTTSSPRLVAPATVPDASKLARTSGPAPRSARARPAADLAAGNTMSKKDDDRAAYEERAAEIRRQIAEGKRIAQIMAEQAAERARKLIEQQQRDGY